MPPKPKATIVEDVVINRRLPPTKKSPSTKKKKATAPKSKSILQKSPKAKGGAGGKATKKAVPKKKSTPKKRTITKRQAKILLDLEPKKKERPTFLDEVHGDPLDILEGQAATLDISSLDAISNPVPRTGKLPSEGMSESISHIEHLTNVKWSRYIPYAPTAKQLAALMLADVKEILYGGALGGGKSDWLAMDTLRYCDVPGFAGIIFRRQLTDLKMPGALIDRISKWLQPWVEQGYCKYVGDEHKFVFKCNWPGTDIPGPSATLQFGYIGEAAVRERYQSAEFQKACFDELGQWPDDSDYLFMFSRLRKTVCIIHGKNSNGTPNYVKGCRYCDCLSQVPTTMRAASNPGPPWIKKRWGIRPDPSKYKTAREALIAIQEGEKVHWVGTDPKAIFLPAYLWDNPHLDWENYRELLANMSESERSRLEDGNWESRVNARFKRVNQRYIQLQVPDALLHSEPPRYAEDDIYRQYPLRYSTKDCHYAYVYFDNNGVPVVGESIPFSSFLRVFLVADPAVTVRKGPIDEEVKQKNSYTSLSVFAETMHHELLWLNNRKFRKEIPDVVDNIVNMNEIWQPNRNKIETSGVGIGVAQYCEAAGIPVERNYKKTDKIENSLSAQLLMRHGKALFPINAYWLEEVEDVLFGWTGLPTEEDDVVDNFSDAANEISLKIAHEISAPAIIRSKPRAVMTSGLVGPYGTNNTPIPRYGL